jgi:hypothetical protein
MPWFRVFVQGVDQGHSWFATNEAEVLQDFIRTKASDREKDAKKLGFDVAQYQKTHIQIVKE